MATLIRCEDKYGVADIIRQVLRWQVPMSGSYPQDVDTQGEYTLQCNTSSQGVFAVRGLPADVDSVVFVYDMDKLKASNADNILTAEDLAEVLRLVEDGKKTNVTYRFVPTVFCAETICLHKLSPDTIDFSAVFSTENTAHLHTLMLTDILEQMCADRPECWKQLRGGRKFKIKQTHRYLDLGYDFDACYQILKQHDFSKFNRVLFDWLCGGDLSDIRALLTAEQAIAQQRAFVSEYRDAKHDIEKGLNQLVYCDRTYTLDRDNERGRLAVQQTHEFD